MSLARTSTPESIRRFKGFPEIETSTMWQNETKQVEFDDITALVSDETRDIIFGVNFALLCFIISLLGIVSNSLNVVVFLKMGFNETVNISLLGLTVSDLCSLITLLWVSVLYNPWVFNNPSLPFIPAALSHLTGGWPHVAFTRVTGWITAFVTFERSLCIVRPLQVKAILTGRRVTAINVTIFIVVLSTVAPTYYTDRFAWVALPGINRTVLGLTFTDDIEEVSRIGYIINITSAMASFLLVFVFTLVLVVKLGQKAEWRQNSTTTTNTSATSTSAQDKTGGGGGDSTNVSTKEQRVVKMMVTVSTIFIVCFLPTIVNFIITMREPEFSVSGRYKNIYAVAFSVSFVLEGANSSVNFLVYYNMSSRYKAKFDVIWRNGKK